MGNKMTVCFTNHHRKDLVHDINISDPLDDLGHSFCYVRPDPNKVEETTTFRSISGASVSANTSTPLSTDVYLYNNNSSSIDKASAFESSTSFASIPLQVLPRDLVNSGPLYSGPIENGFFSGPLFSGPMEKGHQDLLKRSYSHAGFGYKRRLQKGSLIRVIKRVFSRTFGPNHVSSVAPVKNMGNLGHLGGLKDHEWVGNEKVNELTISSVGLSSEGSFVIDDDNDQCLSQSQNLQWAQGKAGEDRVHVVVSEEHGWVFVGIYDGFNGPDAPDFLLSNMYQAVHKELKGLLWDDQENLNNSNDSNPMNQSLDAVETNIDKESVKKSLPRYVHKQESYPYPSATEDLEMIKRKKRSKVRNRGAAKKWEENQRRWKVEFDRERLELDRRLREHMNSNGSKSVNHMDVLKALSRGLKKTEEAFLDIADQMLVENPELALMGSCVLVMLMKGEDVYIMNVGDSRAVLGQKSEPDLWSQDLEKINEETWYDLEVFDADIATTTTNPSLTACQLSMDHSTSIEEEVQRIKSEHPDDPCAVMNDRVKGSLKVTRAFGAGFLKQPKWNNALLEMFRIDYTGNAPYINCLPYLHHHRLGPRDRFLILSSDGLYQYFTNEEAVSEVELFIQWSPEGDPAQHLVEEVLLRAAKKAGLDFHELLEIPQGDRRRYHDDVSIIVISLEGRIWRSCV